MKIGPWPSSSAMLTLKPGSACDVCAEEYAPQCLPHSIPCGVCLPRLASAVLSPPGHVLCASCCAAIVAKTALRLQPACPFCRDPFSPDSVRLVRLDFPTSGWSTPRRYPHFEPASDFTGELLAKRTEQLLRFDPDPRSKPDTRRLEDKVARIAAKKSSVEEVSALHKELEDWLRTAKDDQHHSALFLSAALLRAILMNHLAHSEASRIAKSNELALKSKIEDLESAHHSLDVHHNRCVPFCPSCSISHSFIHQPGQPFSLQSPSPHALSRKNSSNKKTASATSSVQRSPSFDLPLVSRFLPLQSPRLPPPPALPLLRPTPALILSILVPSPALPGPSPPLLPPLSPGPKSPQGSLHARLLPLLRYQGPTPLHTPLLDQ